MFSSSKSLIIYFGVATAITNSVLVCAPLLSAGLITSYGYSESQASFIIGSELIASAMAAIPGFYWVIKFNWAKVARFATFALILTNLFSIFLVDFDLLLFARIMAGIFSGTLLTLYIVLLVFLPNTEKLFSGKLAVQLIVGAFCITIISYLVETFGMHSVYGLFTFLSMFLLFRPKRVYSLKQPLEESNREEITQGNKSKCALVLIILFIFGVGINSVWTDLARVGTLASLELRHIGWILSFSTILSILTSFVCSSIGLTFGRDLPIRIGVLMGIIGCVLLFRSSTVTYFAFAACLICVSRVITVPYLVGKVAKLNKTGRLAIATHMALAGGMGSGSYLVSILSAQKFNLTIFAIALVLLLVTLCLTFTVNFRTKPREY